MLCLKPVLGSHSLGTSGSVSPNQGPAPLTLDHFILVRGKFMPQTERNSGRTMKGNEGVRTRDWRDSWLFQVTGSLVGNIPGSKNRRTICSLPPGAVCLLDESQNRPLTDWWPQWKNWPPQVTSADNGQEPKKISFQSHGPHSKTREPRISTGLGSCPLVQRLAALWRKEKRRLQREFGNQRESLSSRISSGLSDYST